MENGSLVELSSEEGLQWENGQDTLQNALEQSSLDLEQSAEQSVEQSQASTSLEYELGAFTGYDLQAFGTVYGSGLCAGFAVSVVVALACWLVALAIKILREGGQRNE